jgi:hypothetical protein
MSNSFQILNYVTSPTNDPPTQPSRPYGITGGSTDVEYTYTSISSNLNGDQIWFIFDWGLTLTAGGSDHVTVVIHAKQNTSGMKNLPTTS